MVRNNNNLDLLRLCLAFFVFMFHWNGLTSQNITNVFFNLGHISVDMFFIVSGFLIFWSFDKNKDIINFYIRRMFRIFPLYFVLITLQTIFFIVYSSGNIEQISKYFISNIFFLNFLSPSVLDTLTHLKVDAINGSLWTLKNEILFYFFVPLIYAIYKRWNIKGLIALYVFSVGYVFLVDFFDYTRLSVQFPAQLRLFLVGVIFYIVFDKLTVKFVGVITIFSVSCYLLFYGNIYFQNVFYPICVGCWVISFSYLTKTVKIPFDFSYSFYIIHFPIIQLSLYFGFEFNEPIYSFFSLLSVILVLSFLSERFIEKKSINLGKYIIQQRMNFI